jgi:hypothetical protein
MAAAGAAALPLPAFAQAVGPQDRLIVPGERIGLIRKGSTYASIARAYGAANLRRDRIGVGEGETEPGARVFARKPEELEVLFQPNGRVSYVQFFRANSPWRTADGVRIGSTLAELEAINGGPFTIAGFGWDYGGYVKPEKAPKLPELLEIRLDASSMQALTPEERQEITGDITVATDHPAIRKLTVKVGYIKVKFPE